MVTYHCKHCDWVYEGYFKLGVISEHDRTHPENHIDNIIRKESKDVKVKCRACGCDEEHTVSLKYETEEVTV